MPTHYQGAKREIQALNAFIPLMRAAGSLAAAGSKFMDRRDLTPGQFGILETLLHLGPLCQRELAQKLLVTGGNITFLVDNLEKRGWVRRRAGRDRRMSLVELTANGRRVIEKIFPQHAADVAQMMGHLTSAEQETLRRLCRKLGLAVYTNAKLTKEKLPRRRK
jgi:MarR family transcriptional regulator, 2-MHQ and catechol-resistance regulon repressor